MQHFHHHRPEAALNCHYIEQHELRNCLLANKAFCEHYTTGNYFFITGRPDAQTIEGWLGRADHHQLYFEQTFSNYTFFQDYEARKSVCFIFDKTTLFRVVSIIPEKPLKFILRQVQDFSKLYSMLNQEEIYQFLQKQQWTPILNILYQHKNSIAGDTLLQQAARTFESEFLRKASDHPVNDLSFIECLEKLYMLHVGKFFMLQPGILNN